MKQVSKALNERITGDWGLVFLLSPQPSALSVHVQHSSQEVDSAASLIAVIS
ncbi:MAG: hypothetical protein V7L11_22860 [Nostoc sp.]|uniref:hypothetical protein n=1 Tax=Nostoc sp. TaxID=1180 RepID=UPI002FFC02D6